MPMTIMILQVAKTPVGLLRIKDNFGIIKRNAVDIARVTNMNLSYEQFIRRMLNLVDALGMTICNGPRYFRFCCKKHYLEYHKEQLSKFRKAHVVR